MSTTTVRRPRIVWRGQDVAAYLYGRSERILPPDEKPVEPTDPQFFLEAVKLQPGTSMYQVSLNPVFGVGSFKPVRMILQLSVASGFRVMRKRIFRVDWVEATDDGRKRVGTTTLWPEDEKDFQGFLTLEKDLYGERASWPPCVYFVYTGPLPERNPQKPPTFFSKVKDLARSFKVLVECWAIVTSPQIREHLNEMWSHDIYEEYWKEGFARKHGMKFRHVEVSEILSRVLWPESLYGINRIYDDLRGRDLVSPLLRQMQDDILEALFKEPELADLIFSEANGKHWNQRLEILFERYYGPKEVVCVPQPVRVSRPTDGNGRFSHALEVIKRLIQRPETNLGVREAALAAYERITGQVFVE